MTYIFVLVIMLLFVGSMFLREHVSNRTAKMKKTCAGENTGCVNCVCGMDNTHKL